MAASKGLNIRVLSRPGPREPQKSAGNGALGPPDILGLSLEIIGFRNRGGGPVGNPQGAQVKTLTLTRKCLTKDHHVESEVEAGNRSVCSRTLKRSSRIRRSTVFQVSVVYGRGGRSGAGVEIGTRRSGLRDFGSKMCRLHGFGPKIGSLGAATRPRTTDVAPETV